MLAVLRGLAMAISPYLLARATSAVHTQVPRDRRQLQGRPRAMSRKLDTRSKVLGPPTARHVGTGISPSGWCSVLCRMPITAGSKLDLRADAFAAGWRKPRTQTVASVALVQKSASFLQRVRNADF